jgi:hypothetical protein
MTGLASMEVATRPARLRNRPTTTLVRQLASATAQVRSELRVTAALLDSLAGALERDLSAAEAADALAQAIVCGSAMAGSYPDQWHPCREFLAQQSSPWERAILERIQPARNRSSAGFCELTHLYEHLLRYEQADRRKRAGVFFTPHPIVRYMLRQIDAQLREEFSLPRGLADAATWEQLHKREPFLKLPRGAGGGPFVQIFDPAVGTGTFLLEAIDLIHGTLTEVWRRDGCDEAAIADRWNDYVPRHLLPRLWGMELLPAPCFLAKLHVGLKLALSGYRFGDPGRIEIHLGNTLAGPTLPPVWCTRSASASPVAERADHLLPQQGDHIQAPYDVPFTVVVGNPPFSSLSEAQSQWITSLVRGDEGRGGYLQSRGQKLGERKTWLHDDYVKFIRYAQCRIETTGVGIAALVTNHGYLTNATFRIMRQELLRAFPRILVVDLHGNRKAREAAPDGKRDENVFGLDQGIGIGFFRRPPAEASVGQASQPALRVEHAELWGSRAEKLAILNDGPVVKQICVPAAPQFCFAPAAAEVPPEYAAAPSLVELLPLHATAPVTARDHFVVAFTRAELRERIEAFRDLSIPDEEIRRRYFTRTRSARYERGDTRSWKLAAARRALAALDHWENFIQPCQYRPLDWRWIFWHPAMIDWPRHEVTSHFASPQLQVQSPKSTHGIVGPSVSDLGLAVIARRQLPPTEPADYFWATSGLALDGIIRNDNRGSESLFVVTEETPREEVGYAYAVFHSPTFRQRYAAPLRRDFPRVLPPRDRRLSSKLASFGRRLLALHTRRPPQFAAGLDQQGAPASCAGMQEDGALAGGPPTVEARLAHPGRWSQRLLVTIAPRFPQFGDGRVWIRDDYAIAVADEGTWSFRVGAHQVARKWLADRRGRRLTDADLSWYSVILVTIAQTRALMAAIDAVIVQYGGFPAAFRVPEA